MHGFNKLEGDGQSKSTAVIRAMHIAFQADEAFKYGLLFSGWNSPTVINHLDAQHALLLLFHRADSNRSLSRRVTQGIGKQVAENLFQASLVGSHLHGG